jgi:hypothetical protein
VHRWLRANPQKWVSSAARAVPEVLDPSALPGAFATGLAQCMWPGRCQVVRDVHKLCAAAAASAAGAAAADDAWTDRVTFYLDGAHTDASILVCLEWFAHAVRTGTQLTRHPSLSLLSAHTLWVRCGVRCAARSLCADEALDAKSGGSALRTEYVLLFNCGHTRDPFELLSPVLDLYQPAHAPASDSKQQSGASSGSLAFQHLLFAPFDQDRPHLQSIPSLQALCTTHKRTPAPAQWQSPLTLVQSQSAPSPPAAPSAASAASAAAPAADDSRKRKLSASAPLPPTDKLTKSVHSGDVKSGASPSAAPALPPNRPFAPWQHTLFGVWDSLLYARHQKAQGTSAPAATAAAASASAPPLPYPKHIGVVQPNVSAALSYVRRLSHANPNVRYRVLATGSLYLVGNILKHLNWRRSG